MAGTVGPSTATACRQPDRHLSFTITGLSIANGASFWIRWADTDLIPGG